MGTFPLEGSFGIQVKITVLDWSLESGNYKTTVQYKTFWKVQFSVTNIT